MLAWLSANAGTIIVCALVLAAAALAVRALIRNKKQGKAPCGCGCSGCAGCAARPAVTPAQGEEK